MGRWTYVICGDILGDEEGWENGEWEGVGKLTCCKGLGVWCDEGDIRCVELGVGSWVIVVVRGTTFIGGGSGEVVVVGRKMVLLVAKG